MRITVSQVRGMFGRKPLYDVSVNKEKVAAVSYSEGVRGWYFYALSDHLPRPFNTLTRDHDGANTWETKEQVVAAVKDFIRRNWKE